MRVGEIIKVRRLELGLTLEDVGNATGVGKSTVRKWETGMIENMRRDKIVALAKILSLEPEILLCEDGNIEQKPADQVTGDELTENKKALMQLVLDCPEDKAGRLLQVMQLFLYSERQEK